MSDTGGPGPQEARFALTAPASGALTGDQRCGGGDRCGHDRARQRPRFAAVVTIAGVGLMIFACLLAVVALVLTARLRTTLALDPESITIIKGRRRRVVPWSTIDVVKRQGPRLLLITKPGRGRGRDCVNPRTANDATFDALIAEIQRRLDADRGYRRVS